VKIYFLSTLYFLFHFNSETFTRGFASFKLGDDVKLYE